jgi:RNA polymerase sigma-70 factor (ECF subfamily)
VNKRAEKASIHQDATAARKKRPGPTPDPEDAEDPELVERARRGDDECFRVLFERYHRRAYSLAFGMVHNQDDALDIVQEAFIKAHRYLDKFEGTSSFYTWFYRIVMNLAIDHIRRKKRTRHVDFNDALDHDGGDGSVDESLLPHILGQNPGKSLARKQIREQVQTALEELSENHRAVLVMREFEGLSYQEMAEVMDCSKGTIMSRLFHARKNMQRRLVELMGGERDLEA